MLTIMNARTTLQLQLQLQNQTSTKTARNRTWAQVKAPVTVALHNAQVTVTGGRGIVTS